MVFEILSILSFVLLLVLSVLFFIEKHKTQSNFIFAKTCLDEEVNSIKNEISENQNVISANDQKLKDFRVSVENEQQALIQQIASVKREFRKYASDTMIDRGELKKKFEENIKTLTDQMLTQASLIQNLRADNEELKKKLSYFTEIGSDSKQLNEDIDLEEEERKIQEATLIFKSMSQKKQSDQLSDIYSTAEQPSSEIHDDIDDDPVVEPVLDKSLLDTDQSRALSLMETTNGNYFITGKAGTGKSFLLRIFENGTNKKTLKVSPTGISALNINGTTIHSAFGFENLVNLNVEAINPDTVQLHGNKRFVLQEIDTLIIDEISMIRADTFDKMDRILRVLNNNNAVFGGKQVIAFGDLFQLPPIVKSKEEGYLQKKYKGIYFFNSDAYKEGNFRFIELGTNHRQKQDQYFFEMLNRMREGRVNDLDISVVNERVKKNDSDLRNIVRLFSKKETVEHVNKVELGKIPAKEYTFNAKVLYQKYKNQNIGIDSNFPINYCLKLKLGALVMIVKNDPGRRWANGTLAIVSYISDSLVKVKIKDIEYELHKEVFEAREAKLVNGHIEYDVVLQVEQYPIVLGYALTIHKSQGQTYQRIACDITDCFAPGQAYVALSRCSSLNGLHLLKSINNNHLIVDSTVRNFYLTPH